MPGKFEGNSDEKLAEKLNEISLDGCDDEIGDVQTFGWYGLIKNYEGKSYIVNEDEQGFFGYSEYGTEAEAQKEFDRLIAQYEQFESESKADN